MVCSTIGILVKKSSQKFIDVQSGPSCDISCEFVVGRGIGALKTSEFIVNELDMQFLDILSPVVLQAPGMWLAVQVMSKYVVKNHKQHRSYISTVQLKSNLPHVDRAHEIY